MSGPAIILQASTRHLGQVIAAAKAYQERWSYLSEPQQAELRRRVIVLRQRTDTLLRDLDKLTQAVSRSGSTPVFTAAAATARAYLLRAKAIVDWTYMGVKRVGFLSEADPMVMRPKTKLVANAASSKKMAKRTEARMRASQARFSEKQLKAMREARQRYEARARQIAWQALVRSLPQTHHHLIPGWISELATVIGTEAADIARGTQQTGDVPGIETAIGRTVKVLAERSGLYSPAAAATLGATVEAIYKLGIPADRQLLASAIAAVVTLGVDRRSGGKGSSEAGALLEQMPMGLAA